MSGLATELPSTLALAVDARCALVRAGEYEWRPTFWIASLSDGREERSQRIDGVDWLSHVIVALGRRRNCSLE
jgi:hypothetical protein